MPSAIRFRVTVLAAMLKAQPFPVVLSITHNVASGVHFEVFLRYGKTMVDKLFTRRKGVQFLPLVK